MKFQRAFCRIALIFGALLTTIAPVTSVYAILNYDTLKFFADNNIIYYDPTPRQNCSSALDCNIAGNTRDEKLWSGLRNLGFTPEQTAALMGNILNEGGSPTRQEDAYNIARNQGCESSKGPYDIWKDETDGQHHTACMQAIYSGYPAGSSVAGVGIGFVGWTAHTVRLDYLSLMQDAGLIKYFEGDAYKTYGSVDDDGLLELIVSETGSEADYWALWCTALKYIYSQFTTPKNGLDYTAFFNLDSVEELTGYVASKYEVCNGCNPGESSYNARIATAQEIYARYQNGAFASVDGNTAISHNYDSGQLQDGSDVTIIGDSITVNAEAAILKLLPNAEIISQGSKRFAGTADSSNPTGQQIVESKASDNSLRSTVIIALGTNNYAPSITTGEIDKMISTIGSGHNIVFVNNFDDVATTRYDDNNALFNAAAVKYDNVSVVDWQGIVQSAESENPDTSYIIHESNYAVHLDSAGQELFAEAIANAVAGNAASLDTCIAGGTVITDPSQAIAYLQQFIIDTNARYKMNYALPPADAVLNQVLNTPADDSNPGTGECWGATFCGQCTALSGWFIQMMTNLVFTGTGNGRDTVGLVASANGGTSKILYATNGEFPSGVAIFSTPGGPWGHTGVILGRQDNNGDFIAIENNQCISNNDCHRLQIRTRSESEFSSLSATFYEVGQVNVSHLGTTY